MEKILREVLQNDKSLLGRREDLIAALEKKVPANMRRDFELIKYAIELNVGEIFLVGGNDETSARNEVEKILEPSGISKARVDFIVKTFINATNFEENSTPQAEISTVDESKNFNVPPSTSPPSHNPPVQESTPPLVQPQQTISPQPQQTSSPSTPQTSFIGNKNFLIGIIVVLLLVLGFLIGRQSGTPENSPAPAVATTEPEKVVPQTESSQSQPVQNSSPTQSQPSSSQKNSQTESRPTRSTQTSQPAPSLNTAAEKNFRDGKTDLSLNGMDLDMPLAAAEKIFGKPKEIKDLQTNIRYVYTDDFYFAVVKGKVDAFVSSDPRFKTLRGIHAGSTYDEVVKAYGTDSQNTALEDMTLYEYPFKSLEGQNGLLRFAVDTRTNRVDYISMRIAD